MPTLGPTLPPTASRLPREPEDREGQAGQLGRAGWAVRAARLELTSEGGEGVAGPGRAAASGQGFSAVSWSKERRRVLELHPNLSTPETSREPSFVHSRTPVETLPRIQR